jgi:hypothetical protein
MEAFSSSERSVIMYQYRRCHFAEDLNIYQQRCENLICRTPRIGYIVWTLFSVAYMPFDLNCVTVSVALNYIPLAPGTVVYLRICIDCNTDIALISVQKKQQQNFISVLRKSTSYSQRNNAWSIRKKMDGSFEYAYN